jgi:hypothetical protein
MSDKLLIFISYTLYITQFMHIHMLGCLLLRLEYFEHDLSQQYCGLFLLQSSLREK